MESSNLCSLSINWISSGEKARRLRDFAAKAREMGKLSPIVVGSLMMAEAGAAGGSWDVAGDGIGSAFVAVSALGTDGDDGSELPDERGRAVLAAAVGTGEPPVEKGELSEALPLFASEEDEGNASQLTCASSPKKIRKKVRGRSRTHKEGVALRLFFCVEKRRCKNNFVGKY